MLIACLGMALIFLVFFPSEAHAWGPISHLDFAQEALRNLSAYPAAIQTLLSSFPKDFLYGTLAADITVGKKYVDYLYNCHNWRVGFLLLNEARDEPQQACAYGYLAHLAADIIAHNFYVPVTSISSYPTRTLGHVYWETRFDARRPKQVWTLAKELCETDFSHDDELFQRMLKRTLFSFRTNKRIFNSILNLHKLQQWRGSMRTLARKSKWPLSLEDITLYRTMALDAVQNFLKNPGKAPCTKVDPTGADKLLYAKTLRRHLHIAYRKKRLSRAAGDSFVAEVKTALHKGVYRDISLPDVSDLFV